MPRFSRILKAIFAERLHEDCTDKRVRRRQGPWLVQKFGEFEFSTPVPLAVRRSDHDSAFVEQNLCVEIALLVRKYPCKDEVNVSIAKLSELLREAGCLLHVNRYSGVLALQLIEHGRYQAGDNRLIPGDPGF